MIQTNGRRFYTTVYRSTDEYVTLIFIARIHNIITRVLYVCVRVRVWLRARARARRVHTTGRRRRV